MFARMIFGADLPTWALLLELLIAGAIVVVAGARLTRLADELANRFNLAAGWVGLILLATVTSLPEVVTGSTAVWIGNTDMAFATIFGSCSVNITLIVLLDAVLRRGSVLRTASPSHTLTSSFGIILIGMAVAGVVLVEKFAGSPRIAQTCEVSCAALILVTYFGCVRLTYRYERARQAGEAGKAVDRSIAANSALYAQLAILSLILVVTAWWLTQTGDVLSEHEIALIGRPLGATFVGACFLALATSLPEIVTGVTAVRLGNLDLALGNIFGSNMFNIFVIPILKVVSLASGDTFLMLGPDFDANQNVIAGLLPILLTAIAVAGLTYRSQRRVLKTLGFDSVLIGAVYLGGICLLLVRAVG